MTRPCRLRRAVTNRHRYAIEQASRRWRGGRRDGSARTRRKILISTQVGIENTGQQPLRAGRKRTEPAKALVLRALAPFVDALAGVVDDDRGRKRLRADPDDALARADDDEAADGLTRAHDLEAVAEGEKRGAYGYN